VVSATDSHCCILGFLIRALGTCRKKITLIVTALRASDSTQFGQLNTNMHQLLVCAVDVYLLGDIIDNIKSNTNTLFDASKKVGLEVNLKEIHQNAGQNHEIETVNRFVGTSHMSINQHMSVAMQRLVDLISMVTQQYVTTQQSCNALLAGFSVGRSIRDSPLLCN
jgi:hypothetical protein